MLANFIPATGRISFVGITIPGMGILDGIAWVSYRVDGPKLCKVQLIGDGCVRKIELISDVHGIGKQQVIYPSSSPQGLELDYRINNYDQQPFLLFQISITNQGTQPIFLQELCLFQADPALGGRVEMPGGKAELHFFQVGWHSWAYTGLCRFSQRNSDSWIDSITRSSYANPVTPRPHRKGEFSSEGWCVLANERTAIVAGFTSTAHQFGQLSACTDPDHTCLKLSTQADGIRLDPGETCSSEWAYLQFISLPAIEPMADYVQATARQMQARSPTSPPPAMWTHWYRFYHKINEKLLLENVEALARLRAELPIELVELDDGYQPAWGDWTFTNRKFPGGLEHLAGQIAAKGFIPGLWLAPLAVQDKSRLAREHPDWLVRDRSGKPAGAGFFYFMNIHALDTSHPAVLDHLAQLMDTLVHRWGYRMLKLDFLNAGALPGVRYNPKLTRAECLRQALQTIRQAVGNDTYLLASGCPFGPAISLVDAMRISPDTAPRWEPYFHWLPWAGPFLKRNPSMPSLRNSLRQGLNLSTLHQRWWWNDPDCLLVRDRSTRLTKAEVQSSVTLVGLSGGLLVSSDDVQQLNPERLRWISLLTPNMALRGLPVDWLENEMPSLYQAKLDQAGGSGQSWQLVALFNWKEHEVTCRLQLDRLGYAPGKTLHVFDFWSRKYYRVTGPELVFPEVPAHGCKLLRVCEAMACPQLVGDTLHISQGVEIASWRVQDGNIIIETINLDRQVGGELLLWLPREPANATCNDDPVTIEAMGNGIYAIPLAFHGRSKVIIHL